MCALRGINVPMKCYVLRPTIPNGKGPLIGREQGTGTSLLYSTKGIWEQRPRCRRATAQAEGLVYRHSL